MSGVSAEQLLELSGQCDIPIDIEKLLSKLGVKYDSMDFSFLEKANPDLINEKGKILGAVTLINNDVCIYYSNDSSKNRKRFTLAHELAHCCLDAPSLQDGHIEFRFDERSDDYREIAANIFAGKLLIPTQKLIEVYNNMIAPLSNVLAKEFSVSIAVMEGRLKELKLPFYSPEK